MALISSDARAMGSNRFRGISDTEYEKLDAEGHYLLGIAVRKERAGRTMKAIDSMPAELRACVHEHGIGIVKEFMDHGIRSAKSINYIVQVVRGIQPDTGGTGNYGNPRAPQGRRAVQEFHDEKTLGLPSRYRKVGG